MLLQNEIYMYMNLKKKSSHLISFLWTTNADSYLTKCKTYQTIVFADIQTYAFCWINNSYRVYTDRC